MNRPQAALKLVPMPADPEARTHADELVVRCRDGDMTAWREVFRDHGPCLRRLLARVGVDSADVDDALQDVFIVAHRKLSSFDGRSQLRTWLTGIALRVASQCRRRAMVRRVSRLALGSPAPVRTPEELAQEAQARPVLAEILAGIGEKKRAVFVLYELEGLEGDQIARLLGCSVNTVWSRLRHARAEFEKAVARRRAKDRRP